MYRPRHSPLRASAWLLCGLFLAVTTLHAASDPAKKINFAKGADKAEVKGTLKGSGSGQRDFLVTLSKGQTLSLDLVSSPAGKTFYVVLPPTRPGAPPAREGEGRSRGTSKAALDGDYTVRVFLTHDAAMKGAKSTFTLAASIH